MKRERRKIMLANLHIQGTAGSLLFYCRLFRGCSIPVQAAIHPTQNSGGIGSSLPPIHGATSIANPVAGFERDAAECRGTGRRLESSR
jgi:hypothetical protein